MGRVTEERRVEERKRKSEKKEDRGARSVRKVVKHCVFPMVCESGGSKSGLAKAAGAEPSGQMRHEKIARPFGAKHISKSKCTKHAMLGPFSEVRMSKNCTPFWHEAHLFGSQNVKCRVRTTFGSCDEADRQPARQTDR